jgi:hypothetical protein
MGNMANVARMDARRLFVVVTIAPAVFDDL